MKLAVCIPTHHGRAVYLRELIDSILRQVTSTEHAHVEICISDNASQDRTSEIIGNFQRVSPIRIKYFRFPDNEGIKNFLNVIEMADAEYCWLMGSDDVIIDGGIARVLHAINENPSVAGITVNKLNFDKSLEVFLGPDHEITLPTNSTQTRVLNSLQKIMENLGLLFTFMSAQVFRRRDWISAVEASGFEHLKSFRHFPHTFVFSQIAKNHGIWLWLSDYCVIQRLDNFCVLEEKGNRLSLYATELTEDIEKVWTSVLGPFDPVYFSLMKRQLITYWNPWLILKYKCERELCRQEERAMTQRCTQWFRKIPLFWVVTYPVLITPSWLISRIRTLVWAPDKSDTRQTRLQPFLRGLMRMVRIENKMTRRFDAALAVAERHKEKLKKEQAETVQRDSCLRASQ